MNTDWFYYLNEYNKEMFHYAGYLFMYFLGTLATISSLFTLMKNRSVLGPINFGLLIAYIIMPYLFVVPDLLEGTSLSYSTISGLCYKERAFGAKQVVDKFAEYFRENLDSMGKENIFLLKRN